ncbi:MAG: energy transducer TonB [Steroidobacteraceae bacterium]
MKKHVLLIAATVAALSFTTSYADQACAPRLVSAETSFPVVTSSTRAQGDVLVGLTFTQDGTVTAAEVAESSGSPRLDRAAVQSALSRWKFAKSECEGSVQPLRSKVLVQYQAKRFPTFSALWMPGVRKRVRDAAASGCEVTKIYNGDYVTSCIVRDDARLAKVAR